MIVGTGCDIVKVSRFEKWLENQSFLNRFFHEDEIPTVKTPESLASRFAAKEAFVKALGTGFRGISLKNICVISDDLGKPFLKLYNDAHTIIEEKNVKAIHLSLSHEKEYAIAFVILEN
ncbi:MAG: holo-ACP synthase [Treponemataceae bacterium]